MLGPPSCPGLSATVHSVESNKQIGFWPGMLPLVSSESFTPDAVPTTPVNTIALRGVNKWSLSVIREWAAARPCPAGRSAYYRGNLESGGGAIAVSIGGSAAFVSIGTIQRAAGACRPARHGRDSPDRRGAGARIPAATRPVTGASSCAVSPAGGGAGTRRGLMNWAGFRSSRRRKKRYG